MAKPLVWSAAALSDRLQILMYWEDRLGNRSYSLRLNEGFERICDLISRFPEIGVSIPQTRYRSFVYANYQLVYRLTMDRIELLRIWDTRQDPDSFSP